MTTKNAYGPISQSGFRCQSGDSGSDPGIPESRKYAFGEEQVGRRPISQGMKRYWRTKRIRHEANSTMKTLSASFERMNELHSTHKHENYLKDYTENIWNYFNPDIAMKILKSPEMGFWCQKNIVFEGLRVWVIAPNSPDLIKDAIAAAVRAARDKATAKANRNAPTSSAVSELRTLLDPEFHIFLKYVFEPSTQYEKHEFSDGERIANLNIENIRLLDPIRLFSLFHFHVNNLEKTKYGVPSVNKGAELIGQLNFVPRIYHYHSGKLTPSSRTVQNNWSTYKPSISLSYAAAELEWDGKSLLDGLINGEATYENCKDILTNWFGRSLYVSNQIISRCAFPSENYTPIKFPPIEEEWFPAPVFSDDDQKQIRRKFRI